MEHVPTFELKAIGQIFTPYSGSLSCPKNGKESDQISIIKIFPEYQDCMLNLQENKYIHIIFWADQASRDVHIVHPKSLQRDMGVFSTRSPARPNPICTSLVEVIEYRDSEIYVKWMDSFNGSYLLDIKPYFADADMIPN